ncbi:hypothetical protein POTOM_029915 [Populus tomentosa]|uniref:Uncharacterized protein n=1 Tax=Populus tomentosa TaxID=118781 RepID=A0A8X7ZE10_POPTO|nr:hypothetical protein POTOM_029915 [Populus tomentosa]
MSTNVKPTKLFSKSLSRTDIEDRLSAPTRCLRFFPELEGKSAIESQAIDGLGKQWSLKLSVGKGGIPRKPVITGHITVSRKVFNVLAHLPKHSLR